MTTPHRETRWYVSVLLAVLPLLLVGLVVGAGRANGAPDAQVAIVNLDASGEAAQQLVGTLTRAPHAGFSWTSVPADANTDAYAAVVYLPAGFSISPAQSVPVADITVYVNPSSAFAQATLGKAIADAAATTVDPAVMDVVGVRYGRPDTSIPPASWSDALNKAKSDASALADAASKAAADAKSLSTQAANLPSGKPGTLPAAVARSVHDLNTQAAAMDQALNDYAAQLRGLADAITCPADVQAANGCDAFAKGVAAAADQASRDFVTTPVLVQSRAVADNARAVAKAVKDPGASGNAVETAASKLAGDLGTLSTDASALAGAVGEAASSPKPDPGPAAETLASLAASAPAVASDHPGWTTALLLVVLWLGALAVALAWRPDPFARPNAVMDAPVPALVLGGAQGLLVAAAAQVTLTLAPGPALGAAALFLLAGLEFVAVNRALARWLRR